MNDVTPVVNNTTASSALSSTKRTGTTVPGIQEQQQLGRALPDNHKAPKQQKNLGCLRATILSAYDLPSREPPSYVSITIKDQTALSGPPVQRHKDRNAFKFASAAGPSSSSAGSAAPSNQVSISAPLPELYQATATIRLVYTGPAPGTATAIAMAAGAHQETLQAEYKLKQLRIHEKTWLILHLHPPRAPGDEKDSTAENSVDGSLSHATDDESSPVPTLRLQLTLTGPYRPEIAAFLHLGNAWFNLIDAIDGNFQQVLVHVPKPPQFNPKYLLVPAAPILALTVVSLPLVIGILIMGLPMFLPLFVVLSSVAVAISLTGAGLYASSRHGRTQLSTLLQPMVQTILSTQSGQRMVYQTGPRPGPVKVARAILPTDNIWAKLAVSLCIDAAGSASYLLPVVGETLDIFWAPLQTIMIAAMYDDMPRLKYISFIEEILPFTDIVPSATLGWLWEFAVPGTFSKLGWQKVKKMQPESTKTSLMNRLSHNVSASTAPPTARS